MISVLLNWIYIFATAGTAGCAVLYPFYRIRGYRFKRLDSYFFAGLAAVTVYAQIFSLFAGVGLYANLLLLLACLALNITCGKKLWAMLAETAKCEWECLYGSEKDADRGKKKKAFYLTVLAVLLLIFVYGTSAGFMMYDSNLYHAQSIRWIEEYGVVEGLGNLHNRFAYNSASFALTALYSMKFLLGQSLHTVAGLIAFVVFLDALRFLNVRKRKKLLVSDFARVGAFYYVTIIFREMMSPASDYFTMLLIFYIIVRWLDLLESREKSTVPYGLLCVAAVFAITVKVSAGIILLLVWKPAYMLIKEKRWKEIVVFLGLGLLTAVPFFARNVIISGFLVYPYTNLDFFAVDWRMPVFTAQHDMLEIKSWARGITYLAAHDLPVTKWLPYWFEHELVGMEKLWVFAAWTALFAQLGVMFYLLLRRKKEQYGLILVLITVTACFFFWQFSAPMMRYGYAYPLLMALLVYGFIACTLTERFRKLVPLAILALLVFPCYRTVHMGKDMIGIVKSQGIHVMQQDYDDFEADSVRVGNFEVYVPAQGDRIGYDKFPSTPDATYVAPRGESIEDGFLYNYALIQQEE